MAREPRIHIPGGLYHGMLRGNGGQEIFFGDEDRVYFEALVGEGVKRFGHRIHAYCWMRNHVHLAMQVGEQPTSRILQNLSFRYTRWVNKCHRRMGHLFQGRYKAILVEAERYLLALVRYIHLNPVRARLVGDPQAWKWSSHRAYLGETQVAWLTTEWVLSQLATREAVARQRYGRFIAAGLSEGHREDLRPGRVEGRILGDDCFIARVLNKVHAEQSVKIAEEDIIEAVSTYRGIERERLRSADRSRRVSDTRAVIAYLVVENGAGSLTSVGRMLNRDVATLSKRVRRFRERLAADAELQREIRTVQSLLSQ